MAVAPELIVVPAERVLVITRVFDAPRDLVFRMWTDPHLCVSLLLCQPLLTLVTSYLMPPRAFIISTPAM